MDFEVSDRWSIGSREACSKVFEMIKAVNAVRSGDEGTIAGGERYARTSHIVELPLWHGHYCRLLLCKFELIEAGTARSDAALTWIGSVGVKDVNKTGFRLEQRH